MDGLLYPASLFFIAMLALMFYRSNSMIMMLISIVIGAYIIYSHNTGNTITDYKNDVLDSVNESAGYESEKRGIKGYDPEKAVNAVRP